MEEKDLSWQGLGIGLRSKHFEELLEKTAPIGWLEALTENYLGTQGRPRRILAELSEKYPIALHGVSLSLGSQDPLDWNYIKSLKALAQEISAVWISDHLCWTGVHGKNIHDLLPIPYTEEALSHMVHRIKAVQDYLGQEILIENPSSYIQFRSSTMDESEFLNALAEESGCRLLLDVNNVYVSSINHGFDAKAYLDNLNGNKVGQYHLAGHRVKETFILDSHIGPVPDQVWNLFAYALRKIGWRPSMVEWDDEIPSLEVLLRETYRIQLYREQLDESRPEVSL